MPQPRFPIGTTDEEIRRIRRHDAMIEASIVAGAVIVMVVAYAIYPPAAAVLLGMFVVLMMGALA